MRINAYVLAGDPAWVAQSISSYYDVVDTIVVSYDAAGLSWSGHPLPVDEALSALKAADPAGKMVYLPGNYSDPERHAMESETAQRQAALDAASRTADWVLQLDTDEVLPNVGVFITQLLAADASGADAMHYPLRNIYGTLRRGRYLERSGRLWGYSSSYPGALAVRSGTQLAHARQTKAHHYRVDVRPRNTDPAHPVDVRVDAVVRPQDAGIHMSWTRTPAEMLKKSQVSGHVADFDWNPRIRRWLWRQQHPYLTVLTAPIQRDPFACFRISKLDLVRNEL